MMLVVAVSYCLYVRWHSSTMAAALQAALQHYRWRFSRNSCNCGVAAAAVVAAAVVAGAAVR